MQYLFTAALYSHANFLKRLNLRSLPDIVHFTLPREKRRWKQLLCQPFIQLALIDSESQLLNVAK